jgi:DNA-binding HxlR family transcriptional regulator/putative sterol carrier protein
MSDRRSYGDPCGIARALDLVGERWALLVVRELTFGPKRFTDLRAGLAGASPNVLSQRLRDLEEGGVIRRHTVGAPTYELTERGQKLHPILLQLGRWGAQSSPRPSGPLSVDAFMVALESTFRPDAAAELSATFALHLGEDRFTAAVDQGTIAISRGTPRNPDATITCTPGVLRALVFGDQKLQGAAVELAGDARLARGFFRLFARP